MKAIIMAGGEGSRLRPLTCARPKPMVPIVNSPCLEHIVNLLRDQGISEIGVTLQYMPDEIRNYFGTGKDFGVNLHYFVEEIPLGTAGSVKNAASFLDETFIVISGDAVTDCSLQEAVAFHKEKGALVTIVLAEVTCPLEYGVVIMTEEGKITRFLEKPGWGEVFSDQVNTGIYILEPEILDYIEADQQVDFAKDVFPKLLSMGKGMYAITIRGKYWCDIGTIEQYAQAHLDILEGRARLALPGTERSPGVWLGERSAVDQSARLTPPVVIGEGCTIGPQAEIGPGTVLGREVRVGRGASVKRSVVWDGALIDAAAELRGAVIGWRGCVQTAASCFEGSVVGDRSVVGERCVVRPGVKIWPGKWVEKGTRLSASLVWGHSARTHFFGSRGVAGDLGSEINPEIAARIGAAVGSVTDGRFSLGTDGHPASRMVKHAVLSGLLATGIQTVDLGSLILPVHRFGIRVLSLNGGVHIYRCGPDKIMLRFFNDRGIDFSRSEQRRVEGMLSREEYRYATSAQIAGTEYYPDLDSAYRDCLLGFLDCQVARRARLRIAVDYQPERWGRLLPEVLDALGCSAVGLTGGGDQPLARGGDQPLARSEMLAAAGRLGQLVRDKGAHLGAVLDLAGEEMVLVDERGTVVQEDRQSALAAAITLQVNDAAALVLPVTAPEAMVEQARRCGGVRRTKTAPWAQLQAALAEDVVGSQRRFPQFFFANDALAGLGMVLEHLARAGRPLSLLISELPGFATASREVRVAWDERGKVLRRLAAEAEAKIAEVQREEMPEGIKLRHPEGWALVLPDADEPVCRVFGESFNQETAESITDMYVQKIQEICSQETGGTDRVVSEQEGAGRDSAGRDGTDRGAAGPTRADS